MCRIHAWHGTVTTRVDRERAIPAEEPQAAPVWSPAGKSHALGSEGASEEEAADGSVIPTLAPAGFKVPSASPRCPSN